MDGPIMAATFTILHRSVVLVGILAFGTLPGLALADTAPAPKPVVKALSTGTPVADKVKTDPVKADATKTDATKTDGDKTGAQQADSVKADPAKPEAAKTETAKADGTKSDGTKTDKPADGAKPAEPAPTGPKMIPVGKPHAALAPVTPTKIAVQLAEAVTPTNPVTATKQAGVEKAKETGKAVEHTVGEKVSGTKEALQHKMHHEVVPVRDAAAVAAEKTTAVEQAPQKSVEKVGSTVTEKANNIVKSVAPTLKTAEPAPTVK